MNIRFQFQTLSRQISILVLAILALLTIVVGMIAYQISRNTIETDVVASLEALATARQTAIKIQLQDYQNSLAAFGTSELSATTIEMLAANEDERGPYKSNIVAQMKRELPAHPNLTHAIIATLSGEVIAATDSSLEGQFVTDSEIFDEGLIRLSISDPFIEQGIIFIELAAPLNDAEGNTQALLIHRYEAHALLSITGDYTGLKRTGETVLGVRRNDEIHFLLPRRFAPDVSSFEPVSVEGEAAKPMIRATAGQSGTVEALDYRSVQVISAYRPIPETGWGIVVKQDVSEAFAGTTQIRTNLIFGSLLVLLAGMIVLTPLVRNFMKPLRDLERATRSVTAGDLSTKVPVSQFDEVGQVAEAFNAMVEKLAITREELMQSNQELASFAYVVSHDLKAPLRGIASLSEWLEEDLQDKLEDDQVMQMQLLRERVQRMDALINGLLDYSRIGRIRNLDVPVDVNRLLVRVVDSISPPEWMQINVAPGMPKLQTDELHLNQVFQNLIGNAVNHHPGPEGLIEISCQEEGGFWKFVIRDDGAGIVPRHHVRIFQIFQSLQRNADVDSTGIGLALVRKIVEEHGGEVGVESEGIPGQGAAFYFTWPKS